MRIIRTLLAAFSIVAVGAFAISELMAFTGRDTTVPQITAETDTLEVSCDYTEEDLMQGIYAWDDKEGDLTSRVVISSLSRFVEKGVCNLTYVVFDSSSQSASLTRKVKFTDYRSPRFQLSAPLVFREGEATYDDVLSCLSAQDVLEGDRTGWIVRTDSDVNFQKEGEYSMSFQVENSFGDTGTVTLPIHVVSGESQTVEISLSSCLVYLEEGQKLDPETYIAEVTASDGSSMDPDEVSVSSQVEEDTPGCYQVSYQVTDDWGNRGETWLTVVVADGGDA